MPDTTAPLSPLSSRTDGIWTTTAPVRIVGMALSSTMTVIRLADGSLLAHSPVPLGGALRRSVDALGPLAHVYAPNTFHHLHAGAWTEAYPDALLHAPAGLARKRRDLRIGRPIGQPLPPSLAAELDEIPIDGFRLEEAALFHRPSGTLVVTDLFHNIGRPPGLWTRLYTSAMGFYDRIALSRVIRSTGFTDRAAARASVERLLALPVRRIVVGHGDPIVADADAALRAGVGWLEPGTTPA